MSFGWRRVALATGAANACALLAATTAAAHVGGSTDGFTAGFAHPFAGADHVTAMVALGMWARQQGGRALYLLPATFVAVLVVGAALGHGGFALPIAEQAALASGLVLAAFAAGAVRLPVAAAVLGSAAVAFVHGHLHGSEMPAGVDVGAYAAGFVAATLVLHGIGLAFASRLCLRRRARALALGRSAR